MDNHSTGYKMLVEEIETRKKLLEKATNEQEISHLTHALIIWTQRLEEFIETEAAGVFDGIKILDEVPEGWQQYQRSGLRGYVCVTSGGSRFHGPKRQYGWVDRAIWEEYEERGRKGNEDAYIVDICTNYNLCDSSLGIH